VTPCSSCPAPATAWVLGLPYCSACTEARVRLEGLGRDEERVAWGAAWEIRQSLLNGRKVYGELVLHCGRDWGKEESEEYRDGAVYRQARRLEAQDRAGGKR